MLLREARACQVVPKRAAMEPRVSPATTRYVVLVTAAGNDAPDGRLALVGSVAAEAVPVPPKAATVPAAVTLAVVAAEIASVRSDCSRKRSCVGLQIRQPALTGGVLRRPAEQNRRGEDDGRQCPAGHIRQHEPH